ncbi:MAG TPA: ABC transporter ATP-binding protein [Gemmatimonadales bacterium]|nr:ABC transporter ATP-binding protein [Gemmatimonadales bacterium]
MIDVAGVDFRYGTNQVLRDFSLRAGAGETLALFGANGAGKTTILRLCMALLHPAAGRVRVAGIDTAGLAPEDLAGAVGYLFQRPEDQLVRTTVLREVGYGPERLGWAPDRIERAVRPMLERCGLADQAETHPYDLPLPKRRLVALASVLVTEPKVLLLDEPTALLDRHGRALVAELVRERAAAGCTVMAVVHDPAFAIEALDRGVALVDGRVAEDGSVEQVLRSGAAGLGLPPAAMAALGAGVQAPSFRMQDLASALAAKFGGATGT